MSGRVWWCHSNKGSVKKRIVRISWHSVTKSGIWKAAGGQSGETDYKLNTISFLTVLQVIRTSVGNKWGTSSPLCLQANSQNRGWARSHHTNGFWSFATLQHETISNCICLSLPNKSHTSYSWNGAYGFLNNSLGFYHKVLIHILLKWIHKS